MVMFENSDSDSICMETYTKFVKKTCKQRGPLLAKPHDMAVYGAVLELVAEVGEVTEVLQKASRKREGWLNPHDAAALKDEIGDVLWAVVAVCNSLGYPLEQAMADNIDKLEARRQEALDHA